MIDFFDWQDTFMEFDIIGTEYDGEVDYCWFDVHTTWRSIWFASDNDIIRFESEI